MNAVFFLKLMTEDVIGFRVQAGQRQVAVQPALGGQQRRQGHAAGFGQAAGEQAVEKRAGARAGHPVLGEVGDLQRAQVFPYAWVSPEGST